MSLPWSEGGIELLQKIMQIIDKNGGYDNMADIMICENPEFFRSSEHNNARSRLRNKGIAVTRIDRIKLAAYIPRIKKNLMWAAAEDDFLMKERYNLSIPELGAILKRTDQSIHQRIWYLSKPKLKKIA